MFTKVRVWWLRVGLLFGLGLWSGMLFAHHPTGEIRPESVIDSFLSGLAHPVIGLDHLVFMVALGVFLAYWAKGSVLGLGTFLMATLAGLGVGHISLMTGVIEYAVALSILAMAASLFAAGKGVGSKLWLITSLLGVIHGVAYAEAIVGSEMGVVGSYALGFLLVQSLIVLSVISAFRYFTGCEQSRTTSYLAGVTAVTGMIFIATATLG